VFPGFCDPGKINICDKNFVRTKFGILLKISSFSTILVVRKLSETRYLPGDLQSAQLQQELDCIIKQITALSKNYPNLLLVRTKPIVTISLPPCVN